MAESPRFTIVPCELCKETEGGYSHTWLVYKSHAKVNSDA